MTLSAHVSHSATFHVSPTGSNTPPYDTYAKAAHEIADALLAASGFGDTVLVHTAVYSVDTTIRVSPRVVLAGVGRDSVTVNWTYTEYAQGLMVRLLGFNAVFGLTFNYPQGSSYNPNVIGVYGYSADSVLVHDCRFKQLSLSVGGESVLEATQNQFWYGITSGIFWGGNEARIHDNKFYGTISGKGVYCLAFSDTAVIEHNYFDTDETRGGYEGVYVSESRLVTIRNNIFLNSSRPISWYYSSGIVENNTMIRSVYDVSGLAFFLRPSHTVIIRNNVMQDFLRPPMFGPECSVCPATGPITFVHNVFWPPADSTHIFWKFASPDSVTLIDSANVFALPMFVTPIDCSTVVDSAYYPQAHSPLIDKGDPALLDTDGSRSDIGRWGGPNGASTAYPDQPPLPPQSLQYDYSYPEVTLSWTSNHESDHKEYVIHRDTYSGFVPSVGNQVGIAPLSDSTYVDTLDDSLTGAYYQVVVLDSQDQGCASEEVVVIPTGVFDPEGPEESGIPRTPRIVGSYPNPFNASTVIVVGLGPMAATATDASVVIYDILGHRVRSYPVDVRAGGFTSISWDGTDESGASLASGVYMAQLVIRGSRSGQAHKMVVIR